jgi:hypothetical protein
MRFCPFCSADNIDEATHCSQCARRLPPLPPRRRKGTQDPIELLEEERPASKPMARVQSAPERDKSGPTESEIAATRRRSAPPAPSRVMRDQRAAAQASREIRLPTSQPPAPSASTSTPAPTPARAPASGPVPRPTPARDTEPVSAEEDEWPAPSRPPTGSAPVSAAARARTPAPPPIDPDDWAADANRALGKAGPGPSPRAETIPAPPPTLAHSGSDTTDLKLQRLEPVPDVPESGLINSVKYALSFAMARWKRRAIIKDLSAEIKEQTSSLDLVLGTLGKQARSLGINNSVLESENAAIDEAEARRAKYDEEVGELGTRRTEENTKFAEVEGERQAKADEADEALQGAQRELAALEAQRRGLRDKRKAVERQQRGYLKAADDREDQAAKAQGGDARAALRRAADELRRDAAKLDPERQDIERRLGALEKPISRAMAKAEALKAELESARRSLNDVREGHRHRLAELEAEQGRKSRELAQAESEIQRRLVTLGTLVNLHRPDAQKNEGDEEYEQYEQLRDLFVRIDGLRGAIGQRSNEIDRLTAEREAYDRQSLVRGFVTLGAGVLAFITLLVILLAILD